TFRPLVGQTFLSAKARDRQECLPHEKLSPLRKPPGRRRKEEMEETIETPSAESIPSLSQEAYLVLIYPIGPGMGTRYRLGRAPVTIGRGSDCELLVNDHSVSRLHARIAWDSGGYVVTDLESTNGTLVNKIRTPTHRLTDGDYLQIGKCIYRFLAGDNMESE